MERTMLDPHRKDSGSPPAAASRAGTPLVSGWRGLTSPPASDYSALDAEQVALDATDVEAADNDRSPSRTGDGRLRAPTYAPQVDRPGRADGFCGMRGPSPRTHLVSPPPRSKTPALSKGLTPRSSRRKPVALEVTDDLDLSGSRAGSRRRLTPGSSKNRQKDGEEHVVHFGWQPPNSTRSQKDQDVTFDILGISGKHKGSDGDGSEGTEILEIRLAPAGADALSDDGSIQLSLDPRSPRVLSGRSTLIAMGLVGTSAMLYSLQCLEVKMQAKDFSFHSIAFYRGISGSLVALTWAIINLRFWHPGHALLGKQENRLWLCIRGVIGGLAIISAFAAIQALDLATASVLGLTAPLWTAMLGVFTERGSWTRYDTAAAFICVIGVVLILRPAPFFDDGDDNHSNPSGLGILYGLASALLMAGVNLCIRRLRGEVAAVVTLYGMFGSLLVATPGMVLEFMEGVHKQPTEAKEIGGLMIAGLLSWGSQMCMTQALQMSKTLGVLIVRYTDVVWAFIWDRAVLKTEPEVTAIIGALLIILACVGSTIVVRWKAKSLMEAKT